MKRHAWKIGAAFAVVGLLFIFAGIDQNDPSTSNAGFWLLTLSIIATAAYYLYEPLQRHLKESARIRDENRRLRELDRQEQSRLEAEERERRRAEQPLVFRLACCRCSLQFGMQTQQISIHVAHEPPEEDAWFVCHSALVVQFLENALQYPKKTLPMLVDPTECEGLFEKWLNNYVETIPSDGASIEQLRYLLGGFGLHPDQAQNLSKAKASGFIRRLKPMKESGDDPRISLENSRTESVL